MYQNDEGILMQHYVDLFFVLYMKTLPLLRMFFIAVKNIVSLVI